MYVVSYVCWSFAIQIVKNKSIKKVSKFIVCRGGLKGGFDPATMRSIVHEPRSGEPIFLL